MKANIILTNANVLTMDTARPSATTVAITGDKIIAVGDANEISGFRGRRTKVINCAGRTVVPGFNDAHFHLFSLFRKLLSVDISPQAVRSIGEIKEAIRRKATATPRGKWISGTDYNEFYLAEKRCPTRWDLDEATPDHPVVLSHRSLHACVLNSLALQIAGIGRETEEPPGGRIERDMETGEPSGILVDMLGFIRGSVMPPFSPAELDEAFALANRQLLACGITSLQEATYKNDFKRWQTIRRQQENGKLKSRITMMAGPDTWREFHQRGMTTGSGDNRLQLGAVKFLLEARPEQEQLNNQALECHAAGYQMAFHAVAEETIAAASTAIEYANLHSPARGRRHRIEHCTECPPYLLERLKRLRAVIVTQPANLYYSGERYLASVARKQLPWLYRIRAPLDKGIIVAGSSDAPVIPFNPLVGVWAASVRQAESGQDMLPEERITPLEALKLFTTNATYAAFDEKVKGTISPGKLADIVLLSDDPTGVPIEQIRDIRVEMTMVGGEVAWEK